MLLESDVDITDQLDKRPERGIDPRRHRAALADLATRMVEQPRTVLSRLVELARELTGAESAGISVEDVAGGATGLLRWRDLAGRFTPFIGSTLPRNSGPGGTVLDRNKPVLMVRPERAYPYLEPGSPLGEVLLVPLYVDTGAPLGALWVAHHEDGKHFDGGDARVLSELASFGGVAHRVAEDAAAKDIVATELEHREARYRTLFDAIDAGFCVIELKFDDGGRALDYRFVEFNRAFAQQTGLGGAEGRWMRDLVPNHEQHWFDVYGRVALTGDPVRFENEAAELGRWYDVHAYRIDEPADHRVAVLFNDITARRRAETQLQALNDRLEHEVEARTVERDRLWNISRDPFLIADLDGRWVRVNPAWSEILGWPDSELVGRTSEWMEHPDDRAKTRAEVAEVAAGRTTLRFLNRFRSRDDTYRWFSWTAVRADDFLYCVARDVTEERVQAEALRVAEESLRQSQKIEAVGQLTGGVAHDFNNLLTVIKSSTDLLKRPNLPEERRVRYVAAIADTVDRAAKLTSQLLAFARRQALRPETFDAGRSVRAIADMVGTLTGARIRVDIRIPDRPCFIHADPSQFDTALVNMAVNARDAMNGEGCLAISVRSTTAMPAARSHPAQSGDYVAVTISDTGEGIPAEQLDRIFEPFFTTKEVGQGTGLGLSQVFGFAKQSDGEVTVESEVGRGTTFTLYLPRSLNPPPPTDEAGEGEATVDGRGLCVLVVEDNGDVGTFATATLSELGYRSQWVASADAALAELAANPGSHDIVFSDVVMPGMSGLELGQEVNRLYPDLPVVLATGYSHVLSKDASHGFEILRKPYSVENLSRILQKSARRRRRKPRSDKTGQ